jgi:hypothetical protein
MAACAAVVSERPVACIPCCGSVSPDVMVTGFMRWQHDWTTLRADAASARSLILTDSDGGGDTVANDQPLSHAEAVDRLLTIFQ